LDARHQLDRRSTGPDHGDSAATQVVIVVPTGGMKDGSLEPVDAGERGDRGLREGADAED
jgi:hypothetical protein